MKKKTIRQIDPSDEALVHVAEMLLRSQWDHRAPLGRAVNTLCQELAYELLARYPHRTLPPCGLAETALREAKERKRP